jgi:hypothetical protein
MRPPKRVEIVLSQQTFASLLEYDSWNTVLPSCIDLCCCCMSTLFVDAENPNSVCLFLYGSQHNANPLALTFQATAGDADPIIAAASHQVDDPSIRQLFSEADQTLMLWSVPTDFVASRSYLDEIAVVGPPGDL